MDYKWSKRKNFGAYLIFIFLNNIHCTSFKDENRAAMLPQCSACRVLSESFKKGMTQTMRGKFEGGDTAWEEEKLKSYKKSEIRLVEIQENICNEVERGRDQCHANAEEHENLIEDWWFNNQDTIDLYFSLCIDSLKVCCPVNHFGPQCIPCKGGVEVPCNGNGRCKGNGTRKGNGDCECNEGYLGEFCTECIPGFYEAYRDNKKLLCESCHAACQHICTGPGPKSCAVCKDGWLMDTERGCLDVDECANKDACNSTSQFCVNKEGTFECLECDRACNGCTGDGPDLCIECNEGFALENGMCMEAKDNTTADDHEVTLDNHDNHDNGKHDDHDEM